MPAIDTAPTLVASVPRTPLPFGLFSYLAFRSSPEEWQRGIEWEALNATPAKGIGNPGCSPEEVSGLPKTFEDGPLFGEANPFVVYGSYVCSPVGHTISYAEESATLALLAREEARVERAVWSGDLANEPHIAKAEATTLGGGIVSPAKAVGLLEQFLGAEYGSQGVLHMTREAALIGISEGALEVKNGSLQTRLGTPVVAGSGYLGTSPAGAEPDANTTWIYATPPLLGYRSETFTSSARSGDLLDRKRNDLHAVAERTYVVGIDAGPTAAVHMDTTAA